MSRPNLPKWRTILRWFFVLAVIGLAAQAGRLIHIKLNARTNAQAVRVHRPVPYTVRLREIIHAPDGNTRLSREIVEVVRSDGATIEGSVGRVRTIYFPSALQVDTNELDHTKSSIMNPNGNPVSLQRDPNSNCLNSFDGKPITSSETFAGEETIAGYRTVKIKSDIITAWHAPDYGCALIKDRWDFSADEVTEKELVALVAGEPDPALFDVPAQYQEVMPTELVLGRDKNRRTCNEGARKMLQMLDEDYKRRAKKP